MPARGRSEDRRHRRKELFLVNRTASKAEAIATEIRDRFPAVQVHVGYPLAEVDLVLNATSLGLKPADPLPFDPAAFPSANPALCMTWFIGPP